MKDGNGKISGLKARVVSILNRYSIQKTQKVGLTRKGLLIDMEQGVLNQISNSGYGELFDENQYISRVSGSGNNWFVLYFWCVVDKGTTR